GGLSAAQWRLQPLSPTIHPHQDATYVATAGTTIVRNATGPSLNSPPDHAAGAPADLRAPTSQATVSSPNTARAKTPLHLVAQAAPSRTPAASRHGRQPTSGPNSDRSTLSDTDAAHSAYLRRARSRSISRQANAATMNIARMPSRMAMRLTVIDMPSTATSRPARLPSMVDRNSRRPARTTITAVRMPAIAVASRQPV